MSAMLLMATIEWTSRDAPFVPNNDQSASQGRKPNRELPDGLIPSRCGCRIDRWV